MNINCLINKKNYVDLIMKIGFDYYITFTFNRKFEESNCNQQVEFIINELNSYYFGRKNATDSLKWVYVNELQRFRGNDEPHIHLLIKDDIKLHNPSKTPLKERIEHLTTRVCSLTSRTVNERPVYNHHSKQLNMYKFNKSMNSKKHYDFQHIDDSQDLSKVASYIMKKFEKDLNSDFIHIYQ